MGTAREEIDRLADHAAGDGRDFQAAQLRALASDIATLERDLADAQAENSRLQQQLNAVKRAAGAAA